MKHKIILLLLICFMAVTIIWLGAGCSTNSMINRHRFDDREQKAAFQAYVVLGSKYDLANSGYNPERDIVASAFETLVRRIKHGKFYVFPKDKRLWPEEQAEIAREQIREYLYSALSELPYQKRYNRQFVDLFLQLYEGNHPSLYVEEFYKYLE